MATKSKLFHKYLLEWINLYKKGAVREVTLNKYYGSHKWVLRLASKLTLGELTKRRYQELLNDFAEDHEKQTTLDFHHQIKGAVLEAFDEGILNRDPTRNVVIKGKPPSSKKRKYLSHFELQSLLRTLDLNNENDSDWVIYIAAKTGLRFSEILGITPKDINHEEMTVTINKTWNYRSPNGGFNPTKNNSSNRIITLDWKTMNKLSILANSKDKDKPLFTKRVFNSTVNNYLEKKCIEAGIPIISIHGLRHTHASLLLYSGVSVASVARRLGHSNISTTQQTYLHIIQELEDQDNEKIIRHLNSL